VTDGQPARSGLIEFTSPVAVPYRLDGDAPRFSVNWRRHIAAHQRHDTADFQ
jgi:hypothetical protein